MRLFPIRCLVPTPCPRLRSPLSPDRARMPHALCSPFTAPGAFRARMPEALHSLRGAAFCCQTRRRAISSTTGRTTSCRSKRPPPRALRHDVEAMAARFGVSYEQACHRLSTLQRPGARGVPFFFVRVDPAGNVSKRFSAAGFPFARYGGSCPRWVVHTAFAQPGAVQVQVAELPDGDAYL